MISRVELVIKPWEMVDFIDFADENRVHWDGKLQTLGNRQGHLHIRNPENWPQLPSFGDLTM